MYFVRTAWGGYYEDPRQIWEARELGRKWAEEAITELRKRWAKPRFRETKQHHGDSMNTEQRKALAWEAYRHGAGIRSDVSPEDVRRAFDAWWRDHLAQKASPSARLARTRKTSMESRRGR